MADPRILSRIIQLGKELGANISKSIGTKTNVNFLGSGPKDGMLFQKDINPESFLAIGTQKVLPDIEASIGYASGNKLNGFQLEQLEKNLLTMKESLNPTNVVEMGGAGIDSLRAKSGLGERQLTEAASDVKSIDDAADAAADTTPLMSKLESRVEGMKDNVDSPFADYRKNVLQEGGDEVTGIMATVDKGDLPAKTGAAREFLVNSLKVGDEASSTTLSDVMSAQDMKYIFEGGGGAMGDPLVLVQKYFGPRIAEMIPNGGTTEEIAIFTKRVLNNVEDAKGFRPDEPEFDAMTARFIDEFTPPEGGQPFAKGGRAGYFLGGNIDYSESRTDSGGPQTTTTFDGGNDNPPPVTIGDGGITNVVPDKNPGFLDYLKNPIASLQKYAGVYKNPEDEENKVSKMTTAANAVTNYKDYNDRNQKAADIAAEFAKKEKLYAKGGRAGYAKGGLAKILEL